MVYVCRCASLSLPELARSHALSIPLHTLTLERSNGVIHAQGESWSETMVRSSGVSVP